MLAALIVEGVPHDLQDAVARGMADVRTVHREVLRAVLRVAGVPARLALLVEDRLVRSTGVVGCVLGVCGVGVRRFVAVWV